MVISFHNGHVYIAGVERQKGVDSSQPRFLIVILR